jgi:hypothetical protein
MVSNARSRAYLLPASLLALVLGGCGGIEGQLDVTSTIVGSTVLEPDTCSSAGWDGYDSVVLWSSSVSHWEVEVMSWGRQTDVGLVIWERGIALGGCDHFDAVVHTDDERRASGHLSMSCDLVAGGRIAGTINFSGC